MNITQNVQLELNSCCKGDVLEIHQGDTARSITAIITQDGLSVDLSQSGYTVKYDATIDNIVVAENVECTIKSDGSTVEIPITNVPKSGIMKIDVKIYDATAKFVTAETLTVKIQRSVINNDSMYTPDGSTIGNIIQEVDNARGNYDTLDARIDAKADKATTYTKTEVDNRTTKYIGSNEIDKCDRDDYRYIAYTTDLNGYTGYHIVVCTPNSRYIRTQYLLSMSGGIQYRSATRGGADEAWGAWGAWKKIEGSTSGGTNGKSAYQIAVENGFVGTEQQWLESLKGKTPVKGTDYFTAADINSIVNAVYAKVADGRR